MGITDRAIEVLVREQRFPRFKIMRVLFKGHESHPARKLHPTAVAFINYRGAISPVFHGRNGAFELEVTHEQTKQGYPLNSWGV